jgi:hypothetical protein
MRNFDFILSATSAIVANIFIAMILPRLFKEMNVPNGLGKLRKLIALTVITVFIGNLVIAYTQTMRIFFPIDLFETGILSNFASCARIVNGFVTYLIWDERYHPHKKHD